MLVTGVTGGAMVVSGFVIPDVPKLVNNAAMVVSGYVLMLVVDISDAIDFSDIFDDEQQRISVQVEQVDDKENDVAKNENTVVQHSPPVLQQTNSSITVDRPRRNKDSSIRAFFGIVAMHDLELEQLDVKTHFLHGELEEEIYMDQPESFVVPDKEDLVYKLKMSFSSLKQSPRQWYERSPIYLQLYVDDMLIAAKSKKEITTLKSQLSSEFEMKDLGAAKKILVKEMFHERTKHIDVKYHYVHDIVAQGKLKVCKISTHDNPADMMRKPVPVFKFELCSSLVRITV
ncbi:hypothetical protein QYE76_011571 [Lolium multiflorum]|uniref:Reverse transcriptase Ty1/copia-type domain-containing protein n=1 Tax=Lolium multiflorum TaxID=4521 RepID=A0AAD8TZR4_LOLMU|nr:hypothetical protein QYE76_011571 [Lolium multiflorum]